MENVTKTNKKTLGDKLQEIKQEVSIMQKNEEGYGYKYVDEASILLKVNEKMIDLKLRLIPSIIPETTKTDIVKYVDKKGKEVTDILVTADMDYIWKDLESGESEVVHWSLVGQQGDGSQAFGSGLTYSNRYFLLKFFNISTTEDDPDNIRKKLEEEVEKKKLSGEQTKIKNLLNKAVKVYRTPEEVCKKMGMTEEQFKKDFVDSSKTATLLEQLELLLEPKKETTKKTGDAND